MSVSFFPSVLMLIVFLLPVIIFLIVFVTIISRVFSGRGTVDRVMDLAEEQVRRNHEQRFGSRRRVRPSEQDAPPPTQGGEDGAMDFQCDHCGATAEGPMDLSPSGDVRCTYCGKWFNVR